MLKHGIPKKIKYTVINSKSFLVNIILDHTKYECTPKSMPQEEILFYQFDSGKHTKYFIIWGDIIYRWEPVSNDERLE